MVFFASDGILDVFGFRGWEAARDVWGFQGMHKRWGGEGCKVALEECGPEHFVCGGEIELECLETIVKIECVGIYFRIARDVRAYATHIFEAVEVSFRTTGLARLLPVMFELSTLLTVATFPRCADLLHTLRQSSLPNSRLFGVFQI